MAKVIRMKTKSKPPPKTSGRALKGKERRITRSIRIEPGKRNFIEKEYGSLQKWFDLKLNEELGEGETYEAEVVEPSQCGEQVSLDDF